MNDRTDNRVMLIPLVKILTALSVMTALMALSGADAPVSAQTERGGCQFQIYTRSDIEFAGPAGGDDFRLKLTRDSIRHGANIQVANAYGTQSCSWQTSVNQNWVTLSQSSGTLPAEDDVEVTVSINERAGQLSRGIHSAQITFTSRQDPQPNRSKKVKVILHAQEPCDLQVIGGAYRARALQGEVPAEVSRATLNNGGDAPCEWQAHSDVSWLTVTPTSGTVLPRDPQQITIKANAGAAGLAAPVDYVATIRLQWRETHEEYQEIEARLDVDAPPCELHFPEGQRFETTGKAGSTEFLPTQQSFLLENHGGTPCYVWQAHHSARWLSIDDDTTIYPGNATEVIVRVNQGEAAQARPGTYDNAITFGAGNQYASNGVQAQLTVEPLPCRLEIVEEDLYFRIEPEGLLQSAAERFLTLRNHWTNDTCEWQTESAREWLTTEPSQGTLAGGQEITVAASLDQPGVLSELDAGNHTEPLGFAVTNGATDEPVSVTVDIACTPGEPCAYLHITHIATIIGEPATISLSIVNGWETEITAQLVANMPSGWELEGVGFADKCSAGLCTESFKIQQAGTEHITFHATPNNSGAFPFNATVTWITDEQENADESTAGPEVTVLSADVEVLAIPGAAGQEGPAPATESGVAVAPTDTPRPIVAAPAVATATPQPEEPAPAVSQNPSPGGGVTPADDQRIGDSGIPMNLLFLGIAVGVIVLIVAVVGAILIGFKMLANAQRRTPPPQPEPATEA